VITVLAALGPAMAHARVDDEAVRSKSLFAVTVHETLFVGFCTGPLAVHVSRTAKLVLWAIELANRRSRGPRPRQRGRVLRVE
jgi:hypothetical protein